MSRQWDIQVLSIGHLIGGFPRGGCAGDGHQPLTRDLRGTPLRPLSQARQLALCVSAWVAWSRSEARSGLCGGVVPAKGQVGSLSAQA